MKIEKKVRHVTIPVVQVYCTVSLRIVSKYLFISKILSTNENRGKSNLGVLGILTNENREKSNIGVLGTTNENRGKSNLGVLGILTNENREKSNIGVLGIGRISLRNFSV